MLAGRLVVLGNLGIGKAYPVLAIAAWAAVHDGGNHLNDRQDLSFCGVRLGSAFDLGDPLIQRAGPEPAKRRCSSDPGIAHQPIARKHLPAASRQSGLPRRAGVGLRARRARTCRARSLRWTGCRRWTSRLYSWWTHWILAQPACRADEDDQ